MDPEEIEKARSKSHCFSIIAVVLAILWELAYIGLLVQRRIIEYDESWKDYKLVLDGLYCSIQLLSTILLFIGTGKVREVQLLDLRSRGRDPATVLKCCKFWFAVTICIIFLLFIQLAFLLIQMKGALISDEKYFYLIYLGIYGFETVFKIIGVRLVTNLMSLILVAQVEAEIEATTT